METIIKSYIKKGKDAVLNTPEIERKVRDATSNDKWGPSGTQMQEISRASYNYECFPIIMGVIWKRINDPGKFWRHVYKSLLLIDYLVRNGSPQVIRDCRHHTMEIKTLVEFQYIEEEKDVGLSVRERAKQVIDLLQDDQRIKEERDKAKTNQNKYVGIGNDSRDFGYGGGGGGGGYGYDSEPYGRSDSFGGGGGRDSYGGGNRDSYGGQREPTARRNSFNGRDEGYNNNSNGSYDSDPYSNTRAEYESYNNRTESRRNNNDFDDNSSNNNNNHNNYNNNNNNNNNSGNSSNNNNNNNNNPNIASGGNRNRPRAASGSGPSPATPNFQSSQQPTLIDFSEPAPPVSQPIVFDPLMDIGSGNNNNSNNSNSNSFGGFQSVNNNNNNNNNNSNNMFSFNTPAQQQTSSSNNFLQLTPNNNNQQNNNNFYGQPQQAQQFGQFQNSAMNQGGNKDPFAKDDFGDFATANGSSDFNPFEQPSGDFSNGGNQQKSKDTNDPWSKKDLFDLSNLGNQSPMGNSGANGNGNINNNNNNNNNTRSQPARVANGPITSAGSTIPPMRPMNQVPMSQGAIGMGFNQSGMNQGGMNQGGIQQGGMGMGFNQGGMNQGGMGFNQGGIGFNQGGMQQGGMQQGGMNQGGMGFNQGGMNQGGMGFNQNGMNNNNNNNMRSNTGSMGRF